MSIALESPEQLKSADEPKKVERKKPKGRLGTVLNVADAYFIEPHTVYKWAETGRIVPPIRMGRILRWDMVAVEQHIADGCPPLRVTPRVGRRRKSTKSAGVGG